MQQLRPPRRLADLIEGLPHPRRVGRRLHHERRHDRDRHAEQERRSPPKVAIRLHLAADDLADDDEQTDLLRKAG